MVDVQIVARMAPSKDIIADSSHAGWRFTVERLLCGHHVDGPRLRCHYL